jgi:hypothetical protein
MVRNGSHPNRGGNRVADRAIGGAQLTQRPLTALSGRLGWEGKECSKHTLAPVPSLVCGERNVSASRRHQEGTFEELLASRRR